MNSDVKANFARVVISMGDPAGVGPELCLDVLNAWGGAMAVSGDSQCPSRVLVAGSADILRRVADVTGKPFCAPVMTSFDEACAFSAGAAVLDIDEANVSMVVPGQVQGGCGYAAACYIRTAVKIVQQGLADALVTAPVCKESLSMAGEPYIGHTEMLEHLCGTSGVCMQLASPRITVSLVTAHVPLAQVSSLLSVERINRVINLTVESLLQSGVQLPRIAVCGLNPHSGEGGLLGDEERHIISPAIVAAKRRGLDVSGPLVPDAAFRETQREKTDAYIVMYHDQGLIPFKMLAFDDGVNVALGLPIIRTSPDHGTAFDIAWQGRAAPTSSYAAINMAARMAYYAKLRRKQIDSFWSIHPCTKDL